MTEQKENMAFRYMYGFGILFVVMSHCGGGGFELFQNWIDFGAFHISIFLFGSGYFYKQGKQKSIPKTVLYILKKLILPLYGWNLFYGIIVTILRGQGFEFGQNLTIKGILLNPIVTLNEYVFNLGAWFVFPFAMVILTYKILDSLRRYITENKNVELFLQSVLFLICCIVLYGQTLGKVQEVFYPFIRIVYFYPFYIMGLWYKQYLEKWFKDIRLWKIIVSCLFIVSCTTLYFGRIVYVIPSSCDYPFGIVASLIVAFCGIFFWLAIANTLDANQIKIQALYALGKNTWSIMMHQFVGFFILNVLYYFLHKIFGVFKDFNISAFKSDIWYLYLPRGMTQFRCLYVLSGIGFSLLVSLMLKNILKKYKMGRLCNKD